MNTQNLSSATATDLIARNLMTPTRAVLLAHGVNLTICGDGSVECAGPVTDAVWTEADAAEEAARPAAYHPADGSECWVPGRFGVEYLYVWVDAITGWKRANGKRNSRVWSYTDAQPYHLPTDRR